MLDCLVISYSYVNIDIVYREQLTLDELNLDKLYKEVLSDGVTKEMMVVSSCNRIEATFFTNNIKSTTSSYITHLSNITKVDKNLLCDKQLHFINEEAKKRFFKVVSSLDSMVLGETQVAGQYRSAFKFSLDHKYCSENLSRLFHFAFKCATKVRNDTGLGKLSLSVASIAVSIFKDKTKDYKDKKILVIGSGKTGSLVAKYLIDLGLNIFFSNRTFSVAIEVANRLGINSDNVLKFEELSNNLNKYDVIFSATSSPIPIIDDSIYLDNSKEYLFFDLAVPRDIKFSKLVKNHVVYSIEDFKYISEDNLSTKREYLEKGLSIVNIMYDKYIDWIKTLEVEPFIKTIRQKAKDDTVYEVSRLIKKKIFSKDDEIKLRKMSYQVMDIFLHNFSKNLRSASEKDIPVDTLLESLNYLFDISNFEVKNRYNGNYKNRGDV